MAKKTYGETLKDPRWQKKRLEIFERDRWACVHCGRTDQTLHVHHCWYVSGREPWDYPDVALETVCEPCHGQPHVHATIEGVEALAEAIVKLAPANAQIGALAMDLAISMHNGICRVDDDGNPIVRDGAYVVDRFTDDEWPGLLNLVQGCIEDLIAFRGAKRA